MDLTGVSKLANTQSVIRNKFAKAYTLRCEHENDVNQSVQSLVSKPTKRVDSVNGEKKTIDPNELCNQLRLLLTAQNAGNANHTEEINTIIAKLHELEILI